VDLFLSRVNYGSQREIKISVVFNDDGNYISDMWLNMSMEQWWDDTNRETELLFRDKPVPSIATLPTKIPTWVGLGSNSGLAIIAYNTSFVSLYAFLEQFCRNHDFPMLLLDSSSYVCSLFLFSPTHCCRTDFSRTKLPSSGWLDRIDAIGAHTYGGSALRGDPRNSSF
jgi:hypothetical protein